MWDQIIDNCFKKVKNFCKRSKEGDKEKSYDQSLDSALGCAYTTSKSKHNDLKKLYDEHADQLKKSGEKEKVKLIIFNLILRLNFVLGMH